MNRPENINPPACDELDIVRLATDAYKNSGLKRGEEGTIVFVHHQNGRGAYEVEFTGWTAGYPLKVKTLEGEEITMVEKWKERATKSL